MRNRRTDRERNVCFREERFRSPISSRSLGFCSPPFDLGSPRDFVVERADTTRRSSRAALFPISVNFDDSPHAIEVIGITACESVECGSVLGIDDKKAADRGLAVFSY